MAPPRTTLIVKQPVLHRITNEEILSALTEEERAGDRSIVELDVMTEASRAIETGDWSRVATDLTRQFNEKVKPQMKADSGLAYFGTAPVPLAMQMGSLIDSWEAITTYLRHHERKTWSWGDPPPGQVPNVSVHGTPQEVVRADGEAIIRVSTSIEVDPWDTRALVANPLAEIDIKLEPTGLDAVGSMELLDHIAAAFRQALDAISEYRPKAQTVHVFAAVPVGLAFRMGTRISSTMHPRIQTYQFSRTAEVRYHPAIVLNERVPVAIVLTDAERAQAAATRKTFVEAVSRLRALASAYKDWAHERPNPSWLSFVLADSAAYERLSAPPWTDLVSLSPVTRSDATVDLETREVEDGFRFDPTTRTWQLGDDLLAAFANAFPIDDEQARAARMLLLHEGIHECHRLTSPTGVQIGLFPKIVEEIDYQADVWAMLHQYRLEKQNTDQIDARAFFLDQIRIVTRALWAFDAGPSPLHEIQIRRLNRYLIWYWQYLRIEDTHDLASVADVLSRRPLLEITGPSVVARGGRIYYQLDPKHVHEVELAVLHDNAVHRLGATRSLRLAELLDGLRARNGDRVKEVLRGAFEQLRTNKARA